MKRRPRYSFRFVTMERPGGFVWRASPAGNVYRCRREGGARAVVEAFSRRGHRMSMVRVYPPLPDLSDRELDAGHAAYALHAGVHQHHDEAILDAERALRLVESAAHEDPVAPLLDHVEGRAASLPLAWAVRWAQDGRDPAGAAWEASGHPTAMGRLLVALRRPGLVSWRWTSGTGRHPRELSALCNLRLEWADGRAVTLRTAPSPAEARRLRALAGAPPTMGECEAARARIACERSEP